MKKATILAALESYNRRHRMAELVKFSSASTCRLGETPRTMDAGHQRPPPQQPHARPTQRPAQFPGRSPRIIHLVGSPKPKVARPSQPCRHWGQCGMS